MFGTPDEYYGEQIATWIQIHSGETITEVEVHDYGKYNIAHFKIPKYILFDENSL